MTTGPLEPPPQARPRINRLAVASQLLAEAAGCVLAIWVLAAIAIPLLVRRNLVEFPWELSRIFSNFGVMAAGIPILLIFLTSLAGLWTGRRALTRIKEEGGIQKEYRLARAGVILAIIGITVGITLCAGMIFVYFDVLSLD